MTEEQMRALKAYLLSQFVGINIGVFLILAKVGDSDYAFSWAFMAVAFTFLVAVFANRKWI